MCSVSKARKGYLELIWRVRKDLKEEKDGKGKDSEYDDKTAYGDSGAKETERLKERQKEAFGVVCVYIYINT